MAIMPSTPNDTPTFACASTPFVKWAGGKTQLLGELMKHIPQERPLSYVECFAGSAALFFHLRSRGLIQYATLGDANKELIVTYQVVRDNVEGLIRSLRRYERMYLRARAAGRRRLYERVRARSVAPDNAVACATRCIFLNKTGYNGLYRVNKQGRFNTPHGDGQDKTVCDAENLRACSRALQGIEIVQGDFANISKPVHRWRLQPGDVWYADPPYVPRSATSDFTSYTKDDFGPEEHTRLRDVALDLKKRGVHVLLSHSDTPFVRKLYAKGFDIRCVRARRSINSVTSKRGHVGELLIW